MASRPRRNVVLVAVAVALLAAAVVVWRVPLPGGGLGYGNGISTHGNPFPPGAGFTVVQGISSNDGHSKVRIEGIGVATTGDVHLVRVSIAGDRIGGGNFAGTHLGTGCPALRLFPPGGYVVHPTGGLVVVVAYRTPQSGSFSVGPYIVTYRQGLFRHRITLDVVERGHVAANASTEEGIPPTLGCSGD